MKVLLVSDFYPPVIGGMEKHVHHLATGLIELGHQVEVITTGAPAGRSLHDGVDVTRCAPVGATLPFLYQDAARPYHPPMPAPPMVKAIRERIRASEFDVVHAHGWSILSAADALDSTAVPLVASLHDYGITCVKKTLLKPDGTVCSTPGRGCLACSQSMYGLKGPPLALLHSHFRRRARRVDRMLAVSNFVADSQRAQLFDAPIVVVPNFYHAEPAGSAADSEAPYFLYLGALTPEKGYLELAQAWAASPIEGFELRMIGRASPGARIPQGERLIVQQNVSSAQVQEALAGAYAVVCPAVWPDPCPTVAFEAMAHAKPLVATAHGGFLDIVHHESNGLLVPPRDGEAAIRAMRRLASDPVYAARMGAHGRDSVLPGYTRSVVIRKIVDEYRRTKRA